MLWRRDRTSELRRVYREHVGSVYAFFAYSVPRAFAEDLTSATFERIIRSWDSFDPRRAPERVWIMAIARNLLTDHFRRQSHREALSTDEHPGLLDARGQADDPALQILDEEALRAWLEPLSEREREVVALRYAAELPASEVAELLELTPANVHQIASRALRRLKGEAPRLTDSV